MTNQASRIPSPIAARDISTRRSGDLRRWWLRATCAAFLANLLLPNALPFIAAAHAEDTPRAGEMPQPAAAAPASGSLLALSVATTNNPADVAAPGARAVTDAATIHAKLDDVTIYGRYVDNGDDWIEYHLADGRTAYWEKGCTYPGKWWIADDGEVCYAYPNYRNNAPNCFIMFERPDGGVQFVSIGDTGQAYLASDSSKIMPGNDAHLPVGGISPCVGA